MILEIYILMRYFCFYSVPLFFVWSSDLEDTEHTEDSRDLNKEKKERLLDIMSEPEICLEDRDLTIDAANVPPNMSLSKADIEGGPQMPGQDEDSIHQTIMKQVRNLKHL